MFDPPEKVPFGSIGTDRIRCAEHIAIAREAAEKSVVLLKNNGVLPISRGSEPKRLYVFGHNAANTDVLLGNYFGVSDSLVTVLEGIAAECPEHYRLEYRIGTQPDRENANPVDWSIPGKFDQYDLCIAVMGLVPMLEGEEGEAILSAERGDRTDITLPKHQIEKLRRIKDAGLPLVVVLAGGSALAIPEVQELADSVLFMWYPGEQGGAAVARILFGTTSPSGKLPVTFPRSVEQLPAFDDYSMEGRTYRFMKSEPLYPFGFGLSYTTFVYGEASPPETIEAGDSVSVSATITNTGAIAGAEVVQCYITDEEASVRVPRASLCGFKRVFLSPGEQSRVEFVIGPDAMAVVLEDGASSVEPGRFTVTIGGCSPGDRGRELGAPEPARVSIQVHPAREDRTTPDPE